MGPRGTGCGAAGVGAAWNTGEVPTRSDRVARRAAPPATVARAIGRGALALLLIAAGVSHLSPGRRGYRIVVPDGATRMLRLDKDAIIVASGVVELGLGAALLVLPRERRRVGAAVAAFFVAVFPGNVHQWRTGRDAPMMRTDRARFIRLLLQPLLVAWALWSTSDKAPTPSSRSRQQKGRA